MELLLDLKRDPYRLPYDWRDLVVRTPAEILESPLAKIRSWITRVHLALEEQSSRVKLGISDIRRWLIAEHEIDDENSPQDDIFYMPGNNDESYDSDDTAAYVDKYPDEKNDTWDNLKCALASVHAGGRLCEKKCLCLSDRLSVCTTMPEYINLFSPSHLNNNPYTPHPL